MEKEFVRVILDFSDGSAYQYNVHSRIRIKIMFRRLYEDKMEDGILRAKISNEHLHDVVYLIKRGYPIDQIEQSLSKPY